MFYSNCRSHFSLGASLLTPEEIVEIVKESGGTALALCDDMRLTGLVEFTKAAKKAEIQPIIGARLFIVDELIKTRDKTAKRSNKSYYLRVMVRNEAGYRALLALLSRAFDEDHFYEVPRLLLSDVCEVLGTAGRDACLVTLGDFYGALAAGRGSDVAQALSAASVPCVSEFVPLALPHWLRLAQEAFRLQESDGVPVMMGMPFFYRRSDQADSLDLLRAIALNHKFEWSTKHYWRDYVIKDKTEMGKNIQSFMDAYCTFTSENCSDVRTKIIGAWKLTQGFPATVSFEWKEDTPSLPKMASDEYAEVLAACKRGWVERFARPVFGYKPTDMEPYKKRLAYELDVLRKLKFESYFLLVSEIVQWSKSNGIRVGPARGSVGGSLVAYLMGITDIDPLRFNLLFERFINPDRIDLPDADLDFMSSRRHEIVEYIRNRFGDKYVAGVSNYGTMGAAGALKDVCSKLNVEGMAFGKYVPKEHGQSVSLDEAIEKVPELEKFASENPEVVRHARNLENRMRSYGTHAAGIVVSQVPLSERAVVEQRKGDFPVINWDKRLAELFGLVKIDILGLSNLDMIDIILKHVFKMRGVKLEPTDIPLDDPKVMEAFGKGATEGVFQFESPGMRKLLRDMAVVSPLTFEDITAATALYRPGPMDSGLMDQFVKIKQGSASVSYPHPSMEDALKDTYGVMIYQEEVMQVSRDFAGFTLVEADHLRKAMGKKDKDKMRTFRDKFVEGAVALHGVAEGFAGEIFDQIEKFAGYGFNKSHASAYSIISYITMYLKVYYPAEFFCGLLSILDDPQRKATALIDMKRSGVTLLPPDINDSSNIFEPLNDTTLLMPFNAIKGVSDNTANAIMKARESGRFTSIADLEQRVEKRKCNSRHRDLLNKVGAFARVESSQLPSTDHTRRRDQVELLEGLISDAVIVDREGLTLDAFTVPRLEEAINGYRNCGKCELSGLCHPKPHINGPARVMLVVDGPNYKEEAADSMGCGRTMEYLEEALNNIGLSTDDVYITALIKSPKPENARSWSNRTLAECPVWLNQEIDILKPPVIVVLGSLAFRHFVKDSKGGINDMTGRIIYDKARDANIVIGLNPNAIFFDESKQAVLNDVIAKIADLLPA